MKKFLIAAAVMAVLAAAGNASAAAKDGSIQIKGSDTMVNLVQAWAEKFMEKNPGAFIAVTGGGSGTGFAALINGSCDMAASSREIKPQETELAAKKGGLPYEFKVALDGLVAVVHPSNPISQLTVDELAAIFTGKITSWKELGGGDLKIVVLSREVNSGTHVYFKEHVLRKGGAASKEEFSRDALLLPSSQAIADEIAQNSAAIGYYGMGYISPRQKAVSVAQAPGGEYVSPSVENVVSGKYPISRPLYIYSKGEPQGGVKAFVDYVLSPEGQGIVTELDFVPLAR